MNRMGTADCRFTCPFLSSTLAIPFREDDIIGLAKYSALCYTDTNDNDLHSDQTLCVRHRDFTNIRLIGLHLLELFTRDGGGHNYLTNSWPKNGRPSVFLPQAVNVVPAIEAINLGIQLASSSSAGSQRSHVFFSEGILSEICRCPYGCGRFICSGGVR